MKRTKIICTLGPATNKKTILRSLMRPEWILPVLIFRMAVMKNMLHV